MKRIVGIFETDIQAERAIAGLRSSGYNDDEISIITKNEEKYDALTTRVGTDIKNDGEVSSGAATGAVTGGTIGGLGGLLLGLGALAIPGVGPIVAAGPIAAAITGALAGGAVGGLAGALINYGVPEQEAAEYEERIKRGDIMVLVDEDETRRDQVYDNFYDNESHNRNTYRDPRNPAYDGGKATHDKEWNEDLKKYPGDIGNTNHIVDSHQQVLDENEPLNQDKPFELDRKLSDVDKW